MPTANSPARWAVIECKHHTSFLAWYFQVNRFEQICYCLTLDLIYESSVRTHSEIIVPYLQYVCSRINIKMLCDVCCFAKKLLYYQLMHYQILYMLKTLKKGTFYFLFCISIWFILTLLS